MTSFSRTGLLIALITAILLAACIPVRFDTKVDLPQPLITKLPFVIALHVPEEFTAFEHREKRWNVKWEIGLGAAQTGVLNRLLEAMFERVIKVDNVDAFQGPDKPGAILEPAIEEYAFVTPRDAGSSFFAVSIKYRMNVYTAEGRLADSWAFTGYGSAPTSGMSDKDSLQQATVTALRDAAAKLAVEFREQAIVRELLPSPDAEQEAPGTSPPPEETSAVSERGSAATVLSAPIEETGGAASKPQAATPESDSAHLPERLESTSPPLEPEPPT